jgi:PAS domain S-box-containing protein
MLQYQLFIILAPITGGLLLALLTYTWRHRDKPDAQVLIWQIVATLGWLTANTLELVAAKPMATLRWAQITYVFITGTSVTWLIFALHYTDHDGWLHPRTLIPLSLSPLLNFVVVITNGQHQLLWREYHFTPIGNLLAMQVTRYGPWFWIHVAYAYGLALVGAALIIGHYVRTFHIYRHQSTWIVIGVAGLILTNAAYAFRLIPGLKKDYSPIGFAWAAMAFAVGIFRYRLFTLRPVARDVLIDNMNDGILVLDTNKRVVDTNPTMSEIVGQDPETLIGQPATRALAPLPDVFPLLNAPEPRECEHTIIHSGTKRAYDVQITTLPQRWGQDQGHLAVFHDVTEREQLIAELNTFAHTVAHDMRQPLGVIGGYGQLLQEDLKRRDITDLSKFAEEISHMAFKMGRILENLMSLASVRRETISSRPLDMGEIVNEVKLRLSGEIAEQGVKIVTAEEWPTALGHAPWIEQVWINYLTNALKHGGETERIELGGKRMDNGTAHFWVRDYGPGISPEAQRKLFQPFSRFDYTTEGHGLGLSIVKRIVEKLGGEAGVESTPGEGSTFYFTLPLAQDTDNAPD